MQALGCFVIICGVLVSSDSAFGFTFGVRQLESENKSDGKVAPAEDATSEVLKKVEDKIHSLKESLIRDINNQESAETDLIQNLRNSTSKSLKIVGDKVVQVEEKVVSTGTKDNATIAIYKIIKFRPLSSAIIESVKSESQKSNSDSNQSSDQVSETSEKSESDSDQTSEQVSETPEKSDSNSDQTSEQVSETPEKSDSNSDQTSEQVSETPEKSDSNSDQTSKQISESPEESSNEVVNSENSQPAENQPSPSAETNQPAHNESEKRAVIEITGPDGVARPIRGIAIKVIPKSDGSEGKNIALQFFKK